MALYGRWFEAENWPTVRRVFFADLPLGLRVLVPGMVRREVARNLYGQGMGRHSPVEIYDFGRQDPNAVSDFLGDKPFLMGNPPTSIDATAYGFLTNLFRASLTSPLTAEVSGWENLVAYCDRIEARFWQPAAAWPRSRLPPCLLW